MKLPEFEDYFSVIFYRTLTIFFVLMAIWCIWDYSGKFIGFTVCILFSNIFGEIYLYSKRKLKLKEIELNREEIEKMIRDLNKIKKGVE